MVESFPRQGSARQGLEDGPERYSKSADHRGDVSDHGGDTVWCSQGQLAGEDAGAQTENAGRDHAGQQDGTRHLGHADEAGEL